MGGIVAGDSRSNIMRGRQVWAFLFQFRGPDVQGRVRGTFTMSQPPVLGAGSGTTSGVDTSFFLEFTSAC